MFHLQWGYAHAFIFSCAQLVWGLAHFKCSSPDPKLGQKCKNSFGHEWGRRKSIFRETNAVLHRISAPCFLKGSRDLKKKVVFLKNVFPFDVDPSQRAADPPSQDTFPSSARPCGWMCWPLRRPSVTELHITQILIWLPNSGFDGLNKPV